ncbi:TerC family protein [Pseudomonas sp. HR96]|uniref:TerC family protein n=1 Tax=Pseudomonas sp. HR96 TaxID=1027966 RepID=UPI002A750DA8|nr:TerC family protein [Pseudomonas sp. HR96]WPP00637.1 TerC family protein [Pseudomonas sp. HR96]
MRIAIHWLTDPAIWSALLQIIAIDLLLGGDNAVVIALACRRLPVAQRAKAIWGGMAGAIIVRIVLLFFAMRLLDLPYLKLVGALLLLWVGIKLVLHDDEAPGEIAASNHLWRAIRTIVIADVVMSLDNVLAVAGAGDGNLYVVSFGVLVSIPIIVLGSRLVLKALDRFPLLITLGGALIGWIAGGMLVADNAVQPWLPQRQWLHYTASGAGALLVVGIGALVNRRRARNAAVRTAAR